MSDARHRYFAIAGGYALAAHDDDRAIQVPSLLAPSPAALERLVATLDLVHARSTERAMQGEPDIRLSLRREYRHDGSRIWCVRENRDLDLPYAEVPRPFFLPRPGRMARDLLDLVVTVHRRARERALAGSAPQDDGNVHRFRATPASRRPLPAGATPMTA